MKFARRGFTNRCLLVLVANALSGEVGSTSLAGLEDAEMNQFLQKLQGPRFSYIGDFASRAASSAATTVELLVTLMAGMA